MSLDIDVELIIRYIYKMNEINYKTELSSKTKEVINNNYMRTKVSRNLIVKI